MQHWHLENIDWYKILQPSMLKDMLHNSKSMILNKGETVFEPTTHPQQIYFVEIGIIRIYKISQEGSIYTLELVNTGEVFGEVSLIENAPRNIFSDAFSDSKIRVMNKDIFLSFLNECPKLAIEMIKEISGKKEIIENRLSDLVFKSAVERLANTLLNLADNFGQAEDDNIKIKFPLTQEEIATFIGTSRTTTSLIINQFKRDKIIDIKKGHVIILNKIALNSYI